jgi:hypothetical protein
MGLEWQKHILWALNVAVAVLIHYAPPTKAFGLFVEMVVLNVINIIELRGGGRGS